MTAREERDLFRMGVKRTRGWEFSDVQPIAVYVRGKGFSITTEEAGDAWAAFSMDSYCGSWAPVNGGNLAEFILWALDLGAMRMSCGEGEGKKDA